MRAKRAISQDLFRNRATDRSIPFPRHAIRAFGTIHQTLAVRAKHPHAAMQIPRFPKPWQIHGALVFFLARRKRIDPATNLAPRNAARHQRFFHHSGPTMRFLLSTIGRRDNQKLRVAQQRRAKQLVKSLGTKRHNLRRTVAKVEDLVTKMRHQLQKATLVLGIGGNHGGTNLLGGTRRGLRFALSLNVFNQLGQLGRTHRHADSIADFQPQALNLLALGFDELLERIHTRTQRRNAARQKRQRPSEPSSPHTRPTAPHERLLSQKRWRRSPAFTDDLAWDTLRPMLHLPCSVAQRRVMPALAALVLALVGQQRAAHADVGSLGDLTVGMAVSAGFQPDARPCQVAGVARNAPGTGCALFAAGIDGSFLWKGRLGVALGLSSVAGQSSVPQASEPGSDAPPAFPDRVSVALALDIRPLAFFVPAGDRSYQARLLHGLRVGIGPSFELVRTALDSSIRAGNRQGNLASAILGMHTLIDGEIPLLSQGANSLSLRISLRLLYVPQVVLNDGSIQSAPFTPVELDQPQGYGLRTQLLFGLVYYL